MILFTTHITSYAQNPAAINSILEGIILDETTGFPLEGANIQIEGVPNQTSTDAKGKFTLKTGQKFPSRKSIKFLAHGVSDNAIIAHLETDVKPNIGKIVYEYANKLKKKSI